MSSSLKTAAVVVSVLVIAGLPSLASAAVAPPNDLINDATKIGTLPFTESVDTTQARGDGPQGCSNNGSVFYRLKPSTDMKVQVDTLGSDYDTVLTVFRGPLKSLTKIKCNDDAGFGYQSVVRFAAEAGVPYFVEVSTCCGSGRTGGGNLVFDARQLPLEELTVDLAVTDGTIDPISGDVTLEGTLDCSTPAEIEFWGALRQRRDDLFIASASFDTILSCTGTAAPFSLEVTPDSIVSFVSGDAKVKARVDAFNGSFTSTDLVTVIGLTG